MTIIVTGGAGFIGGNFIHYHLKKHPEDRVVCIDKLTYAGNLSTLAPVMDNPNFRFCKLDICDREGVFKVLKKKNRTRSSISQRRAMWTGALTTRVSSCRPTLSVRRP